MMFSNVTGESLGCRDGCNQGFSLNVREYLCLFPFLLFVLVLHLHLSETFQAQRISYRIIRHP